MTIIVGLGNPGEKYENTPHNIGFEAVDEFAKRNNFPDFKLSKKFNACVSEKNAVLLAKPQTFMNKSGFSVKALDNFYKAENLIIIHDDIDLPLGKIKVSKNRGSAGHKGVESIIKELGTKNFTRIRIGVSPAEAKPKDAEKYVLKKLQKKDREIIRQIFAQASSEIERII